MSRAPSILIRLFATQHAKYDDIVTREIMKMNFYVVYEEDFRKYFIHTNKSLGEGLGVYEQHGTLFALMVDYIIEKYITLNTADKNKDDEFFFDTSHKLDTYLDFLATLMVRGCRLEREFTLQESNTFLENYMGKDLKYKLDIVVEKKFSQV